MKDRQASLSSDRQKWERTRGGQGQTRAEIRFAFQRETGGREVERVVGIVYNLQRQSKRLGRRRERQEDGWSPVDALTRHYRSTNRPVRSERRFLASGFICVRPVDSRRSTSKRFSVPLSPTSLQCANPASRFTRFHESLALFAGHCFFVVPFYFQPDSTGSHVRATVDGTGRSDKSSRIVAWTRQNMLPSSETPLASILLPPPYYEFNANFLQIVCPSIRRVSSFSRRLDLLFRFDVDRSTLTLFISGDKITERNPVVR